MKQLRHQDFLGWDFAGNVFRVRAGKIPSLTWSEQDDGHGDEGADHQDDQQGDGDAFPVPLRWTHPTQVLQTEHRSGQIPVQMFTVGFFIGVKGPKELIDMGI